MKKLLALLLLPSLAGAATITATWQLPTQAVDGTPLTGNQAISSVEVFLSTSPIPDGATGPTATLTATSTTTTQTITTNPGDTVYGRVRACSTLFGCGPLSNQSSVVVPGSKPGVPTSVTLTIKIN